MRRLFVHSGVAAIWVSGFGITPQASAGDVIFVNGQVKTPAGWATAVAVRDGVIIAVGGEVIVRRAAKTNAATIDLHDATLLPGLHDSHVHPLFAGLEQFQCRLEPGANASEVTQVVRKCALAAQPGEWVVGGNWVAAAFAPAEQTKSLLDSAAPRNPVVLNDEAHHSVWVNSAALQAADISRSTPNPEGGIIEHSASGEPNGLLRESATRLVEGRIPPATLEQRRKALVLAANQMLSFGITSFTVASVRKPDIEPLSQLSGEGQIKQRVRGCLVWDAAPPELRQAEEALIELREFYSRPRFRTDCVKLFLDGVPTESHTGAMLEPYADARTSGADARPPRGLLLFPQQELNAVVTRFDALGLSVKFHAAGDAAVRAAIDAVMAAHLVNGYGGPMHAVGHSTFVSAADIPRVAQVQMAWEFSPYIWYPVPMVSTDITTAIGPERMERWMPVREAVDTKALVVAGSDWSVVPSVNPWLGLETLVTREKPGGSREAAARREAVSLDEAFKIFTLNAARLERQDAAVGSIQVGKRADFVVTTENPWRMPVTTLHAIHVEMTFIDGELVYDSNHPPILRAR